MGITITLVGGPADGRSFALPGDTPPPTYFIPIEQPVTALLFGDLDDTPHFLPAAEYEPLLDRGYPSRTDDGTYRFTYRRTPEPHHPGQRRPTPTLDELADMHRDPPRTAYPDQKSFLLACRIRHSLRRDAGLNDAERTVVLDGSWEHIRQARPDFPERRPFQ